jgi:cytochrome P450
MTDTQTRLPSYRSTADEDPYGFYDRVREAGDVVWDEELGAWLVTSYAACKEMFRNDKVLFRHPYASIADDALREIEGRRSRNLLHGDEHARHHRWYIHRFSPTVVKEWRATMIRPVIDEIVDRFADRGRVELVDEFAERFSVRVIAAVMGLPWRDEEWIEHCKRLLDLKLAYLDAHGNDPDGSIKEAAVAAAREMNEIVTPFIEAAKEREPKLEDIMALLWAEGTQIMPDWSMLDMTSWVSGTFFAGTDTTTHAIANALYLMMTVPGLQDELREGGEQAVARFSEEALRLYGTVHWRFRLANEDTELAGVPIKKDDMLYGLLVGANRDPEKYEHPHEIDLHRKAPRDHLTFSFGPRTCAGAALARAEVQEVVAAALTRMPNLRLDPDAEPPRFRYFLMRSYRPLHALFDPAS